MRAARRWIGGRCASRAAAAALLATALMLLLLGWPAASDVLAQAEPFLSGSVVRVANTDGQRLNLRAGPSIQEAVLARLAVGETLTVTGASRQADGLRWLPVRTGAGQAGWVAADYVALVSRPATATPSPTRAPTATPTPPPTGGGASGDGPSTGPAEPAARPVQVEARVKYPELDGREQEITVWVTRDGQPVEGATVTVETSDGDDDEHFRLLDPTNAEGRTRRSFDVRHEKGTVELRVEAVAPDGGEGRAIVTYFRR